MTAPGISPYKLTTEHPGSQLWWLEDDRLLCRLLADRLRTCGWRLTVFHRSLDMLAALEGECPDLLLLDLTLPGGDGLSFLRQLRRAHHRFPVTVLSELASADERIAALATGADDVLAKPFRFRELIWRIERRLQAASPPLAAPSRSTAVLRVGPLELDRVHGCLRSVLGASLPLSRGDMALLLPLLQAPGVVLSRERLARACGTLVDVASSRTLDMRLSRLRHGLQQLTEGALTIEAVRSQGYRLRFSTPAEASDESGKSGMAHGSDTHRLPAPRPS